MSTITDLVAAVAALSDSEKRGLASTADRGPVFGWLAAAAFVDDVDEIDGRNVAAFEGVGVLDGLGVRGRDEMAVTAGRWRNTAVVDGRSALADVWHLLAIACREATELPLRLEQSMDVGDEIDDDDTPSP